MFCTASWVYKLTFTLYTQDNSPNREWATHTPAPVLPVGQIEARSILVSPKKHEVGVALFPAVKVYNHHLHILAQRQHQDRILEVSAYPLFWLCHSTALVRDLSRSPYGHRSSSNSSSRGTYFHSSGIRFTVLSASISSYVGKLDIDC